MTPYNPWLRGRARARQGPEEVDGKTLAVDGRRRNGDDDQSETQRLKVRCEQEQDYHHRQSQTMANSAKIA